MLDLQPHRSNFRGELLGPEDPGYDQARSIYNGMIDRHPAIVARCADADDVAVAIALAGALDLELAVRGGGPHASGPAHRGRRLRLAPSVVAVRRPRPG